MVLEQLIKVLVSQVLDAIFDWRRARRAKLEAANRRFETEGAAAEGQVEDIRWVRDEDEEFGIFEIKYRYSVVIGAPATKIHFTGKQRVQERAGLAMMMGKPCRVRYLPSEPQKSKLDAFPILAEDLV